MKLNFKTTTVLLAIALIAFGALFASQRTGWLKDKLNWENDKEDRMFVVDGLKAEVEDYRNEAERLKGVAEGYRDKAIRLEDKLAKSQAQEEQRQEQIISMTAREVVEETRRVIEADETEVWANELGLQFTLAGGHKNLSILYSAEYAWLEVIPNLSFQIGFYKKSIQTMFKAFEKEKTALIISHDEIVVDLEKQIADDVKYIKKLNRRFTLARWKNLAIGVGITFAIVKLIDILDK